MPLKEQIKGIVLIIGNGFADDIALVIRGKNLDELVRTCNTAVGRVRNWIAGIGLKHADHKTDVRRGW